MPFGRKDMNMEEPDQNISTMNAELLNMMEKWATDGYNAAEIAAVVTLMGLRIYRSTLEDADYNAMIDSISLLRDKIQTFNLNEAKRSLN